MMKTVVYDGENVVGELEAYVEENKYSYEIVELLKKGLKIKDISKGGERCHPLAVLHTISSTSSLSSLESSDLSGGVCFKLVEYKSPIFYQHQQQQQQDSKIFALYSTCLTENKTVVVHYGDEEIHLVAMCSRRMDGNSACFWGFRVALGLYEACLGMLNLRCLGIVFDLDETLIVANTLRSFEDRIESLQRKLGVETDSQRVAGMMAEVKRYQEDKAILKQYAENDQVVDNGKVHKIQAEVVPALSDNHQTIVRPLIRLQDKNIVLTRINPQIRDTSVLVRLRPAWEDLRSYLTARGRKRFEVYVCTMAERDYALEMWRLLDPDSNLINTTEVLDRIVCVKSGSKKSLFDVFHDGICHPKMGLVIDDRLKVWDEKDQPRVHVVPAFAPYYSPQAEASNTIPVLCVARNVACNVRGGFFKDFDDVLLQRISEVAFEDDLKDVPCSPDVSNYLVSEDNGSGSNGNKEPLSFDGMAGAEVERRLKEATLASTEAPSIHSAPSPANVNLGSRLPSSFPFTVAAPPITIPQPTAQTTMTSFHANLFSQAGSLARPLSSIGPSELGFNNSPAREEGEVPESELDPDTRRRLLILQHGHEAPFPVRPPLQPTVAAPVPTPLPVAGPSPVPVQPPVPVPIPGRGPGPAPRMSWFPAEDHMGPGPLSRPLPKAYSIDSGRNEKRHPSPPFQRRVDSSFRSDRTFPDKQRTVREAPRRDDRLRSNHSFKGDDQSFTRSSSNKDLEGVPDRGNPLPESPSAALREIAMKVGAKVEFKMGLVPATELKFSIEAYFAGERVGEGAGGKRKEALLRAAEAALMNLADRYLAQLKSDSSTPQSDTSRGHSPNNVVNPSESHSPKDRALAKDEEATPSGEPVKPDNCNVDDTKESTCSVSALEELCLKEGLGIDFRVPSPSSTNTNQGDEVYAEVQIDGQVLGNGSGLTWDDAKTQAAENALASLKSMLGQLKRPGSPRSLQETPSKRFKPEYPRALQQLSSRNPRNTSPVL